MEKGLKILAITIIVLLVTFIAFVGLYVKNNNVWENIIPSFTYGMELSGTRELRYVLDDSEEEKNVYIDSEGNILGEVLNEDETTTEEETDVELTDSEDTEVDEETTTDTEETEIVDETVETEETTEEENTEDTEEEISYATEVRTIKANPDEVKTIESYEKTKKLIQGRLEAEGIQEYNLRLDTVTGTLIVEVPDDDNVSIVESSVTTIGKFEIIDSETGLILLDDDDLHSVQAGVYTTDDGYQVCIEFTFNKEGAETLKEISNKYVQTTDEDGETETSYVELQLDGETLMTTYFGEELSNGVIQMSYGSTTTDSAEANEILAEAKRMAKVLDDEDLTIDYTLENDNLVKSRYTDTQKYILGIVALVILALLCIIFIIRFKGKGITASILTIGYISILVLALKYLSTDVTITINSFIAFAGMVVLHYWFMTKLLKEYKVNEDKKEAFWSATKKYYLAIIPIIILAIIFTLMSNIAVSSIGMIFFWGLIIQVIYNIILLFGLKLI